MEYKLVKRNPSEGKGWYVWKGAFKYEAWVGPQKKSAKYIGSSSFEGAVTIAIEHAQKQTYYNYQATVAWLEKKNLEYLIPVA